MITVTKETGPIETFVYCASFWPSEDSERPTIKQCLCCALHFKREATPLLWSDDVTWTMGALHFKHGVTPILWSDTMTRHVTWAMAYPMNIERRTASTLKECAHRWIDSMFERTVCMCFCLLHILLFINDCVHLSSFNGFQFRRLCLLFPNHQVNV